MTVADEGKVVWFKRLGKVFIGWVLVVNNEIRIWLGKGTYIDPSTVSTPIHVIPFA